MNLLEQIIVAVCFVVLFFIASDMFCHFKSKINEKVKVFKVTGHLSNESYQDLIDKNRELIDKNRELIDKNRELIDKNKRLNNEADDLRRSVREYRWENTFLINKNDSINSHVNENKSKINELNNEIENSKLYQKRLEEKNFILNEMVKDKVNKDVGMIFDSELECMAKFNLGRYEKNRVYKYQCLYSLFDGWEYLIFDDRSETTLKMSENEFNYYFIKYH